jgi:hypothetical protein
MWDTCPAYTMDMIQFLMLSSLQTENNTCEWMHVMQISGDRCRLRCGGWLFLFINIPFIQLNVTSIGSSYYMHLKFSLYPSWGCYNLAYEWKFTMWVHRLSMITLLVVYIYNSFSQQSTSVHNTSDVCHQVKNLSKPNLHTMTATHSLHRCHVIVN